MMIDLNGIKVKNRFFVGSGPFKYGRGYDFTENPLNALLFKLGLLKPEVFGGVVTKTLTVPERKGNYKKSRPWKVLRKIPGGWVNRFGWNNCGLQKFIWEHYSKAYSENLIPSIGALEGPEEFRKMLVAMNNIDVLAVEMNISCPHVEILFRNDLRLLEKCFKESVKSSRHPLIVKLGPCNRLVEIAKIAEVSGINAVSLINTVSTFIPGFGQCGMSGPIIKEKALQCVGKVSEAVNIPIIGGGGINSRLDCGDFFSAGADAVFLSSIFLSKPLMPRKIVGSY